MRLGYWFSERWGATLGYQLVDIDLTEEKSGGAEVGVDASFSGLRRGLGPGNLHYPASLSHPFSVAVAGTGVNAFQGVLIGLHANKGQTQRKQAEQHQQNIKGFHDCYLLPY